MKTLFVFALCTLVGCSYAAPVNDLAAIQALLEDTELQDFHSVAAAQGRMSGDNRGLQKTFAELAKRAINAIENKPNPSGSRGKAIEALLQGGEPNHLEDAIIRFTFPFVIDELQKLQRENRMPLKPSDVVNTKPELDPNRFRFTFPSVIDELQKLQAKRPTPLKPSDVVGTKPKEASLQLEDPNRFRFLFPSVIDELQKLQGESPSPLKPSDIVKAKPKDGIEALLQGELPTIHLVAKYRPIYPYRKLQAENPSPPKPDKVKLEPSIRITDIVALLQRNENALLQALLQGGDNDSLAQLEICEHC